MSKFLPILLIILIIPISSCTSDSYFPTYPSGGEYGGDDYYYDDPGAPSGGDYGGGYNPPPDYYDDKADWSRNAEGEWEGFMWEEWRSDGRPLSKKIVAMRVDFRRVTHDYHGRHEWVKVDVLVDGRPVASRETEINSSGHINLASYKTDIDMNMRARFTYHDCYGDLNLAWNEKVKNTWSGKTEEYYVDIDGYFEAGRVRHGHWAAAWDLLDTYGEEAFNLDDAVWQSATVDAILNMPDVVEIPVRQPIQ